MVNAVEPDCNLQVFAMNDPDDPRREVELIAVSPLPFEEVYATRVVIDPGPPSIRVSVDDLIRMKLAVGRPQDLADVEAQHGLTL